MPDVLCADRIETQADLARGSAPGVSIRRARQASGSRRKADRRARLLDRRAAQPPSRAAYHRHPRMSLAGTHGLGHLSISATGATRGRWSSRSALQERTHIGRTPRAPTVSRPRPSRCVVPRPGSRSGERDKRPHLDARRIGALAYSTAGCSSRLRTRPTTVIPGCRWRVHRLEAYATGCDAWAVSSSPHVVGGCTGWKPMLLDATLGLSRHPRMPLAGAQAGSLCYWTRRLGCPVIPARRWRGPMFWLPAFTEMTHLPSVCFASDGRTRAAHTRAFPKRRANRSGTCQGGR